LWSTVVSQAMTPLGVRAWVRGRAMLAMRSCLHA
jgi:hypothetical protein